MGWWPAWESGKVQLVDTRASSAREIFMAKAPSCSPTATSSRESSAGATLCMVCSVRLNLAGGFKSPFRVCCVCLCVSMHVDEHARMHGYLCVRMCACMHACTYAYTYAYTKDRYAYTAGMLTHSLTHEFVHTGDRSILDPQLEPTSAVPVGVPSEASPAMQQAASPAPMQAEGVSGRQCLNALI